jgi:hypothetical protein
MTTKYRLIIILIISLTNTLFADGPPIDSTGKIFGKYISITLDSNQIKHLQTNRYLELTKEQQKRLYFLDLPKYVDIFDPFHRDCTCGQIYGMWYQTDKVAFVIKDTNIAVKPAIDDEVYNSYSEAPVSNSIKNELFIGSQGKLYYNNQIIDIDKIPLIIKELSLEKSEKDYIVIYQPPTVGNPNSKTILRIKTALRQKIPIDFKVYWL